MIRNIKRRSGFSLVEILAVLAIIVLLIGLSAAALMRARINQQVKSSGDVVEKIQVAVDNQYKVILDQVKKERREKSNDFTAISGFAASLGGDDDLAESMLAYGRIRQFFPQTFQETLVGPSVGGVGLPVKSQFLQFQGASGGTPDQQSAALLYAAVSATGMGGSVFDSDVATQSAQMDFQFVGGTFKVYKDAFQSPIGFCRFGTNAELQNPPYVNSKSGSFDPLDPTGKVKQWANSGGANTTLANTAASFLFVQNGDPANATKFNGSNRIPVVYSNGTNKIYESLNTVPAAASSTQDDILGYRLKQLGQRGTK